MIPPTSDLSGDAPTVAINTGLLPTASQHCTRCGATLATDQRYCVECGERRGEPRLPFMDGRTPAGGAAAAAAPTTVMAAEPAAAARKSRFSPSATLVAGTATLVLALGVGVLIGNAGSDGTSSAAAPPVQVVTVAGGGGTAAPTSTTAADTAGTATTAAKSAKSSKAADTKSAAAKTAAAKKVTSSTGEDVPQAKTPVVTKGAKGSGPGYKDGKFTGDFFGG